MMTAIAGVASVAQTQAPVSPTTSRDRVFAAERAFAKTMKDRDLAAFTRHLSKDAVSYGRGVDRGPAAVTASWKAYFDAPAPPFSWEPTSVEVIDSETLALSTGPVRGPDGRQTSTFTSVWRLEPDGVWRVVFDKGYQCPPPVTPGAAACAGQPRRRPEQ